MKPVNISWLLWIVAIFLAFGFVKAYADEMYHALAAKTDGATIVLTSEMCAVEMDGYEYRAYAFAEGFPNLEGCYQDDADFVNVNIRFFDEQSERQTTRSYGKSHFEPFGDLVEVRR